MPVFKYRSPGEMPAPERVSGPDLPARIRALWARSFLLCPPISRRGVRRFRSIEEANEDRMRATLERMRQRSAKDGA